MLLRPIALAAGIFLSALVTTPATSALAPHVHIATMADLPVVEMRPYDEGANADSAVKAAFDRAKKSGKRVLIDLGGNWCTDCIVFANILRLPEVRDFVARHYETAFVDVGRFDRNLQIPARFGVTGRLEGVPSVLIATPDGKLVNRGHIAALADARHMTPQAIADWLAQWAQ